MLASLKRIKSFLHYWLEAVDEHSLHSPFFYDLYTKHIRPRARSGQYDHIESLRKKLLQDKRTIHVIDYGSRAGSTTHRTIASIASSSLSPPRYSVIYARLAKHFGAKCIVELGTSLGINTLYLAEQTDASVITFEGAPQIAEIAALTFEFAGKQNVNLIEGNIDKTLPAFLSRTRRIDMAFMDANHRYHPTVRYFDLLIKKIHERSVVIIDDIHSSEEMEKAWEHARTHRLVYGSADLYRCGILFFDPALNNQHFVLEL